MLRELSDQASNGVYKAEHIMAAATVIKGGGAVSTGPQPGPSGPSGTVPTVANIFGSSHLAQYRNCTQTVHGCVQLY